MPKIVVNLTPELYLNIDEAELLINQLKPTA